jgi:branched-chain amino acid aminotransferase
MGGKIPARLAGRYRSAKFGGNYASNLVPESEAGAHGCDLVLYLDNDGYVQESGTMNIFAITSESELVTPSLGTILEGVTCRAFFRWRPPMG